MMFAIFFVFWRTCQLFILIPTMGMLAWFIDLYVKENALTPNFILILFIVSVLALAWAFFTIFSYHRSSANASFVALVDLCFVGAFIAAVYQLRNITKVSCSDVSTDADWPNHFGALQVLQGPDFDFDSSKPCSMLKACFAFGIMSTIMFFFTAVLAWMHGDSSAKERHKEHHHHHGSRHHSRRRSGSRHSYEHSRRSSHSRHRVYV